ncbi:sulfatase-like hydrolase/transferase [Coraliomargarita sp. SDUM461004]|uniref:Sulfatase-like hydrolase/transferase n=1 Tax=Thalassobacterium sedimentorum TaxID=3041258 RepID=A0ABU1AFC4_9BACT|nr:sulfatase-like hydrolase/transferase [Coraliomargarita sp. SDUM461004]MDQ8193505.1 sulfatase-like hydrolase/transferase [Coraliomargarita sp. SDUM461004]
MKPPNILFISTDELRFDTLGYAGDSIVRTPHIDSLEKDSVQFENAYCPSPICIPSRQCMAMGSYPRTCGVEVFGQDLEPNSHTFARAFSLAGYNTVACGKLHHVGEDPNQGWMRRIGMDEQVHRSTINVARGTEDPFPVVQNKWTDRKEIRRAGVGMSPYTRWDELATLGAEFLLEEYFVSPFYERRYTEQPLMLYLGLCNPHYPYAAEEDLFNYYYDRVDPNYVASVFDHPVLGKSAYNDGEPVTVGEGQQVSRDEIRRATAAYYANIEALDARVGRVIQSIKASGQDIDDWIVVFCSDHGELLGEHSVWEKQLFFEGSARVPLFIRCPWHCEGRSVRSNVNLIDLYATLGELTGVECPEGMESRSLVPLMSGDHSQWDNQVCSQMHGKYIMIKRDSLKYLHFGGDGMDVLFDLDRDPSESENFINETEYADAVASMRDELVTYGFEHKPFCATK